MKFRIQTTYSKKYAVYRAYNILGLFTVWSHEEFTDGDFDTLKDAESYIQMLCNTKYEKYLESQFKPETIRTFYI